MFSELKNTIKRQVRQCLLENRLDNMLYEEDNPAYNRNLKASNLKQIWSVIDQKQKELQKEVFGELSNGLTDITQEKAKAMGEKFLEIPKTICDAGNKKLPSSVLIINMSSSLMCPSFYLGICRIKNGYCYAQRTENQYTNNVLPNRWSTDLMHTQMLQQYQKGNKKPMRDYFNLVETYIQIANAYCKNLYRKQVEDMTYRLGRPLTKEEDNFLRVQQNRHKITDVRLNETGDFHCQLAVDLWAKFAKKIKRKYGIETHAYTARNLDFSDAAKHMVINTSHKGINVGDTETRKYIAVSDETYNKFVGGDKVKNRQPILGKVVSYNKKPFYFYKCPCTEEGSECDRCGVCFAPNKTGKNYTIFVKYHGQKNANGLKGLFKLSEVDPTIQQLKKNGWVTDEEYGQYNSQSNKNRFADVDKKVENQRKNHIERKKKEEEKNKQQTQKTKKK